MCVCQNIFVLTSESKSSFREAQSNIKDLILNVVWLLRKPRKTIKKEKKLEKFQDWFHFPCRVEAWNTRVLFAIRRKRTLDNKDSKLWIFVDLTLFSFVILLEMSLILNCSANYGLNRLRISSFKPSRKITHGES